MEVAETSIFQITITAKNLIRIDRLIDRDTQSRERARQKVAVKKPITENISYDIISVESKEGRSLPVLVGRHHLGRPVVEVIVITEDETTEATETTEDNTSTLSPPQQQVQLAQSSRIPVPPPPPPPSRVQSSRIPSHNSSVQQPPQPPRSSTSSFAKGFKFLPTYSRWRHTTEDS